MLISRLLALLNSYLVTSISLNRELTHKVKNSGWEKYTIISSMYDCIHWLCLTNCRPEPIQSRGNEDRETCMFVDQMTRLDAVCVWKYRKLCII